MTAKGIRTNPLIEAIHTGSLSGVIDALDAGEDIELADMHGFSGLPLRTACFEGELAIVGELLKRGANPNADASDGPGAPLRLAERMGHQDVVDVLLHSTAQLPEGMAVCPVVLEAPLAPLPYEVIAKPESKAPEPVSKPEIDNTIEFSTTGIAPSSVDFPIDDTELPNHFGTETNALSMDLLFLEERSEMPAPTKPAADKADPAEERR
jgi:hypothetical protein